MANLMRRPRREILWLLWLSATALALSTAGCEMPNFGMTARGAGPSASDQAAGPVEVWATGEMIQLNTQTTSRQAAEQSDVFDARTRTVRLTASGNETVAFQIIVEAGEQPLPRMTARMSPVADAQAAAIPMGWVKLFHIWPVTVRDYPAWYRLLADRPADPIEFYDRLVPASAPRQGLPADVEAHGRLALWADVRVPRDARPGRYLLHMEFAPESKPAAAGQMLTVELEVLDLVLPESRPVIAVGAFDHRTLFAGSLQRDGQAFVPSWLDRADPLVARGLVLERQLMVLSHEHHLDLFDTALQPAIKRDAAGQVRLYWDDYDAIARPYLDGTAFPDRLACALWPAPLDDAWPDPARYGGLGSAIYRDTAASLVGQIVEHFDSLAASGQLFFWPVRDARDEAAELRTAELAAMIRARAPRTPVLWQTATGLPSLAGAPATRAATPAAAAPPAAAELTGLVDLAAPPPEFLVAGRAAANARVFLAPGRPPYTPPVNLPASFADVRALAWLADSAGMKGVLISDVLGWTMPAPPAALPTPLPYFRREAAPGLTPPAGAAGDATNVQPPQVAGLFYPGGPAGLDEVLPSVRLKLLRRGLEDVAYISVLRQRDRADLTDAVERTLVRYFGTAAAGDLAGDVRLDGWAADAKSWEFARGLLAEEAFATVRPEGSARQRALAVRLAWQRLDEAAHDVLAEALYTRMDPTARPDRMKVTILAELFNPLGRAAWIALMLPAPPAGVEIITGKQEIPALPPAGRQAAELSYTTVIGPAANGKAMVPLRLAVNGRPPRVLPVHVPLLFSRAISKPLVIDGDLGDWQSGQGNTAGEFRLVGRRGRAEPGTARWGTTVFVSHDDHTLYVAFRCAQPAEATLTARPANAVQYEQLLATGEDLIELVLDPGRRATGNPGLYRLAVKSNGVLVAGRGVPPSSETAATSRSAAADAADASWAAGTKVAIARTADAWIAELAIPLAALGPAGREKMWGINFIRHTAAGEESSSWSEAPRHFWDVRTLGTMLVENAAATPLPAGPK